MSRKAVTELRAEVPLVIVAEMQVSAQVVIALLVQCQEKASQNCEQKCSSSMSRKCVTTALLIVPEIHVKCPPLPLLSWKCVPLSRKFSLRMLYRGSPTIRKPT